VRIEPVVHGRGSARLARLDRRPTAAPAIVLLLALAGMSLLAEPVEAEGG